MSSISKTNIHTYSGTANSQPLRDVITNVLSNNSLKSLSVDRNVYQRYQHFYDVTTKPEVKVTDQKSSGRCWLFAALNVLRREMISKYNIDNFEFSQSYLFFWDKLERLNYGMEAIIESKDLPTDSREVTHLLSDPTCDGGQWDMFCNLVEKHGLVPKSVYRETHHSSNSRELNKVLKRKFREYAKNLRVSDNPQSLKQEYLAEVYGLLCSFLGEPPSHFTWNYTDSVLGKPHTVENITPVEFYRHHVPVNVSDYVCLVNDPRNTYNQLYTVKYLGNVVEGKPIRYLNLPVSDLKSLALKSLQKNKTVWFGCDVMQWFEGDECAMDMTLVDQESILGIKYGMDKTERLRFGESLMTHAMVLTGVRTKKHSNTVKNQGNLTTTDWQVENSWSDKGPAKGFYNMSDTWFNEYVFEVAVPKSILSEHQRECLTSSQVTELPPWDPMGALAQ
jgi:bleomycin hydrolase